MTVQELPWAVQVGMKRKLQYFATREEAEAFLGDRPGWVAPTSMTQDRNQKENSK